MLATKRGIEINREELWALLSFCGDGEQYSVVHCRVNGSGKLELAATDGKRSVECVGRTEGAPAALEVAIDAAFLTKCKDAIDSKQGESLLLRLTSHGLKDALVVDAESGKTIAPIGWNREASTTQITMGEVVRGLKVPNDVGHTGSWCAIDPDALRGLTRVRVATDGCPVTIYPPNDPTAPMHFEARCERGHWKGAITPERVIAPGGEADEPEEEDEGAPGRKDRQTRLDFEERAKGRNGSGPGEDEESDDDVPPDSDPDGNDDPDDAREPAAATGTDDGVIEDTEADRIRDEQAQKLAPAKRRTRKVQKRKQVRH